VGPVEVGDVVRISLHGRRVGGWVLDADAAPPPGVTLRPLAKRSGLGPPPEVIDLASWAAWRWAGRRATFLRTASPPTVVPRRPRRADSGPPVAIPADELVTSALDARQAVLRLPPAADVFPVVLAAAARGQALVVAPSVATARHLALRLRRAGIDAAIHPRDWARAAAGTTVVGARAAAWAPAPDLACVVVVDEHDEAHQEERAPTWSARDVAIERARRAGVPCVLTSPAPSLEALGWGRLVAPSRGTERGGWPILDVIDRRHDDPVKAGLWSERLVPRLRGDGTVLCVLNRTGRARLSACVACGELARCARCEAAVVHQPDGTLACRRCDAERPALCLACGATRLKHLRVGVTRAREELEALLGEPVVEVTGATADRELPSARVYVGTEAVLHQVPSAQVVAFLDIDQELVAPRYRAAEQAMGLLVRAARVVGARAGGGRLVVQTRLPRHEVLDAVLKADPGRLAAADDARRRALRFPPHAALAEVSGAAAGALIEALGRPLGIDVLGPDESGRWLLRAADHQVLADALAATPRPAGRLRVAVDPPRV